MPIEIKQLVVKSTIDDSRAAVTESVSEQRLDEIKDSLRRELLQECQRMISESRSSPRER